jgi:hypothetical protein
VRWLQARPAPYSATTEARGGVLEVVVDAVVAGAYVNDRPLVARFQGPRPSCGRWRRGATWASSRSAAAAAPSSSPTAPTWWRAGVATPDPELAGGDGAAALAALAERTGGDVVALDDLDAYQPAGSATSHRCGDGRPRWRSSC